MIDFIEIIKAFFIGIVEGVTEWLPISSTGHMILFDELVKLEVSNEFRELFLVVIQIGAICAVPVIFWNKIYPFSKSKTKDEKRETWSLWFKIAVGVIPATIVGVFVDDYLDERINNYVVVSIALVVYGIAFIIAERLNKNRRYRVNDISELSYKDAFLIGIFQLLSFIPGTSRSGSTMLGGISLGVSRSVSAEFSFFMAMPIMLGASLLKIIKFVTGGFVANLSEIILLFIGIIVSFLVSLIVIRFLMNFVKRHSIAVFGIYRIVLGTIVLSYFLIR